MHRCGYSFQHTEFALLCLISTSFASSPAPPAWIYTFSTSSGPLLRILFSRCVSFALPRRLCSAWRSRTG
ncbi:hypothetical protein LY76DRAFT_296315 [Colletotrichum caudatum]|nr:hypothetical protein LY76DRAFT_296315 [Colletotrichum caudatum]